MVDGVDYCKTCFHVKDAHFDTQNRIGFCSVPDCVCTSYVHGETRVTSSTGASKGTKEERFDLIPVPALTYLARLYGKGAEKYAAHNWRLGYDWSKSYAAAQRHMNSFWAGEDIDPETQVPHVINAAFHMFALATYITEHPEFDDRFETREVEQTQESRSDEKEDGFFIVKWHLSGVGWQDDSFHRSLESANIRITQLQKEFDENHSISPEIKVFEGSFSDGG